MDQQTLRAKLSPDHGKVVFDALTPGVGDFLMAYYDGEPVVFTDAEVRIDDAAGAVVVSGRSSFLNIPDLPVTARFTVDQAGAVHASLAYQLRDGAPGPNAWTFSRSFPELPAVMDYGTELPAGFRPGAIDLYRLQRPFLDALYLFDTWFVVSTHAATEPASGVPLAAGINFVSKMSPRGMVGLFEHYMGHEPTLTLHGTIRVPKETDRTLPLAPLERAWDRQDAPGIHLEAALDLDCKLGSMRFDQASFRVYSPLSTDWMEDNASFQPLHGYTGRLTIPSANVEVELAADLKWNLPSAMLYGTCHGITLGKLAHLLDLAGSDGLSSHLPGDLQKAVDTLDKLELMQVAVDLGVYGAAPEVTATYVTVGFPDLRWKVWGDHLEVDSLACRFAIQSPFAAPSGSSSSLGSRVAFTLFGTIEIEGLPLSIVAEGGEDFSIYAATEKKVSLPLDKLLRSHAPGIPAPSALTVNSLAVTIEPGRSYGMSVILAGEPDPWVIPVGHEKLTVSDVSLQFATSAGGASTGSFAGKIAFSEGVSLAMSYDVPGSFAIRGKLPRMRLSQVLRKLCNHKTALPAGFDIDFERSLVLIQEQGGRVFFQLATVVQGFGSLGFEVREVSAGTWGFALGLDMDTARPSHMPGLGGLKVLEEQFALQKFLLVVSSVDQPSFQFPDLTHFNTPQLGAGKVALPAGVTGVPAGVCLFAEWTLDAKDKKQKLVKTLLGLEGTQQITIQVSEDPVKNSKLFIGRHAKLQGHPFDCEFGILLQDGTPGLFLTGTLTVDIQKHPQTFDLTTLFLPNGVLISGDIKGSTAIAFGPFKLSSLAFMLGASWEGIPSVGIAAEIDVKKFSSSVALFLDSEDPSKSLVAGSVSDLSLADIVETLAGSAVPAEVEKVLGSVAVEGTHQFEIPGALAQALDALSFDEVSGAFHQYGKVQIPAAADQLLLVTKVKGSLWHLTDRTLMRHYQLKKKGDTIQVSIEAQFYCAPMDTYIGTVRFPQGTYVNGALSFLGFHASATIDVSWSRGISYEGEMDEIVIGSEALFSIAADEGGGGPRLSISTFVDESQKDPAFRQPHFYINGMVDLLGIRDGILITLTVKGFEFDLKGSLAPGANYDVHGYFAGPKHLGVGGKVKVGLGRIDLGALGKVEIDTDAEATLDIQVQNDKISAKAEADFEALGQRHHIASFDLDVKTKALNKFAETLVHKAEDVLKEVFKDATKWATAVGDGLVDGVTDTTKVLKDVYGKSEEEAKKIANETAKGVEHAAQAVGKEAEKVVKDPGKEASKAADETGKAASQAATATAKEASKQTKKAEKEVSKAAKKIKKIF